MDSPSGNIEFHEIYAFFVVSVNKNTFHPFYELFSPTFLTKSLWGVRIYAEPNNFKRLAAIVLGSSLCPRILVKICTMRVVYWNNPVPKTKRGNTAGPPKL